MLRIKHKNISMQFIALVVLCLFAGLMMCLSLPPAYAAERREPPYYAVDSFQKPGVVFRIVNKEPDDFFGRRSGNIYSIAMWRGQLYFCSANERRIYQRIGQRERVVFEHTSYVRDVAFDNQGNLYFSEATGSRSNGRIYKLTPPVDKLGSKGFSRQSRQPFYTVHLKTVDGFWAGDFTFDAQGKLYLSTGNHIPAFIYEVSRNPKEKGGQYGSPKRVYKDIRGAIKGIALEPNIRPNMPQDFIYFANWKQTIYRLNIRNLGRSVAFSRPGSRHLSDIAFDFRSPRRN